MADGTEPIDREEIIYRRVPEGPQCKPSRQPPLSQKAFGPRPVDVDGISLLRAQLVDGPEAAAAEGPSKMTFYVVAVKAGDLEDAGIKIVPDPYEGCPGHALAPAINFNDVNSVEVQAMMLRASLLPNKIYGPFAGKK